jgi:putative membrane protein
VERDEQATQRTRLANERTLLAWMRTGFTAFAVALGVGNVVPALTDSRRLPFVIVGSGFAVLGIGLIVFGQRRYGTPGDRALEGFAAAAAILGLALLAVLVLEG